MIRFALLGGRLGPVPWPLWITVGAAASCAAVLLQFVTADGPWILLRALESLVLAVVGVALLGVGLVRRARTPPDPPPRQ